MIFMVKKIYYNLKLLIKKLLYDIEKSDYRFWLKINEERYFTI